jgi:hypothetical protein
MNFQRYPTAHIHLREFVYILTYGGNKYKDITRNIEGIYKMKPYEICKLLTAVIEEKEITVRVDEKIILQHCLDIRPLGNGKIDEFSKISDSTYSFSSDGTMSYNISDKQRNSL